MDESHAQEIATWFNGAREHGLPVVVTGFMLFRVEFGLTGWLVLPLLLLLMGMVLTVTAYATFGPDGTASRDW